MSDDTEILLERRGTLGLATLNRPRALNALNLPQVRELDRALAEWAADPAVQAVVIQGAGDRAFCAGGDVRAVALDGLAHRRGESDGALTRDFFREEYTLNRNIYRFPKPYLSFLDGITMGGGKGLSAHGSHRVVTERITFAMPETNIGLFPDVGGSYFLPRLPGRIGLYLALTGARIGAADCLHIGFATHFVPSDAMGQLLADLAAADLSTQEKVDAVISGHQAEAGPPSLPELRERIDRCFGQESMEAILASLEAEEGPWAEETLATLRRMSPTSLAITFRQLREGARLDFEAAMTMEYRIVQRCMEGHDFYEGIRAQLIDKDRAPKWQPATLEAVTEDDIDRYFEPLGDRDLRFEA